MAVETIQNILEYPSIPDLGIEGSTRTVWVPRDFIAAKTYLLVKEGIELADKIIRPANKVVVKTTGSVSLEDSIKGDVYNSLT